MLIKSKPQENSNQRIGLSQALKQQIVYARPIKFSTAIKTTRFFRYYGLCDGSSTTHDSSTSSFDKTTACLEANKSLLILGRRAIALGNLIISDQREKLPFNRLKILLFGTIGSLPFLKERATA